MQKFIDKIKQKNLQENYSENKIFPAKKIRFNNILKKKKIEEDKAENAELAKVVKSYYHYRLIRKTFSAISNAHYKKQCLLCLFKLNDIRRKRKLVFLSFLKNKCVGKLTKCVIRSMRSFLDARERRNLKFRLFQILKQKQLHTKGVYLRIKKRRINKVMLTILSAWSNICAKSLSNKLEKAQDYHTLRKKRRIFYLWKRMTQDERLFKNVDVIFSQLEEIVSSWRK
ncbi:conserved Plasmodium protein, unknown function [Plasmodium ovale]|uniref:Uncharacterized protein n=1 Tax=Plasmodium ovale TaxID=36330 RepID=A0A1C3KWA9_PLAOA|nr:conserved Plasmodium protein, unknown function [Plasmodium ovale]